MAVQLTRAFRYFESRTGDKYGELRDARRTVTSPCQRFGINVRDALAHCVRLHRGADRYARRTDL